MRVHVSGQGLSIPRFVAFLILAVMAQPRPSLSDQITLPAVQDNTIYSESDLSYGGGICLQVGRLACPRRANP